MAPPVIYTSPFAPVSIPESSLFTYLFSKPHAPSSTAYIDGLTGATLTRGELRESSLRLARAVRTKLALARGDVALVFSPNTITYPVVLLALLAAGASATLASASYTASELAHQYKDARARLLFVHPVLLPVAREMLARVGVSEEEAKRRLVITDISAHEFGGLQTLGGLLADSVRGLEREEAFDGPDSHSTAVICYSSGTTGLPKGVETTHRNLTAQLSILTAFDGWHDTDTFVGVLPFFHVYGLVVLLLNPLLIGASVVVLPQFTPDTFFGAIAKYRVTQGIVVPPVLLALVHHPAAAKNDLTSLRALGSGAAPLSVELTNAVYARLKTLGISAALTQGFGMTELSPVSHLCLVADAPRKPASVGTLLPLLSARLVDEDGESDVTRGELWVRGPTVMKGYVNNPTATKATITEDGWLKTGDIAIRDEEGFFWIVDRKKELIKYKGFQVSPAELEDTLLSHADIVDAAVIGIDDATKSTELPRAYIVRKPGAKPITPAAFEQDVQAFVAARVAKHKQLRGGVVSIDAIPKSAAGKILRRQLKERALKELAAPKVKL